MLTTTRPPPASAPKPGTIEAFRAQIPGRYAGIPFEEYLLCPLMSKSIVKEGVEPDGSMLHMKYALDNRGKEKPTDAMVQGSALHCAFLEPALMPTKVALWTGDRRAGKEWEAFKEEHAGKAILTKGMHANLVGMIAALRKNQYIRKWLSRIDEVELSAIGFCDGMKFRVRADALTDDPLLDLKKISDTSDRTVANAIGTYGYAIQGHIYREVLNRDRFILGFVEEYPPHDVRVVELSPAWFKIGQADTRSVIQRMQLCEKTGIWPGRAKESANGDIEVIEPPEWRSNNSGVEITIGGEKAF